MIFTAPLALLLLLALIPIIAWGLPRTAFRWLRDWTSLLLRCLLVTLIVLALAGMQIVRSADKLAVVFLVDASDSITQAAREAQIAYLREALTAMTVDETAAVVVFGANAVVERGLSAVRELPNLRSAPITTQTDLDEAIRIGLGLFPADAARRLVVLSDGAQTVGDAGTAARRAAATGVEISYVPLTRDPAPEVQVIDVRAPEEVGAGQEFDLSFTVRAEAATPATITVSAGGGILFRTEAQLSPGDNNYAVSLTANEAGFRDFEVRVDPQDGDSFYQNNALATFSQVVGPPRVLLIARDDGDGAALASALTEIGLDVERVQPVGLPIGIAPLAEFDSIILSNVPATVLSEQRMETLASYVRDLGGGLVVVGGPDAYAPGGYFQTPLEEALPVEMQIRDQQRLPQLTIAYVIDRSGSMGIAGPSGFEAIELAKEAMIRSIDFLQSSDRAGVISFDMSASWIADIQPVLDRIGLQTLIGTLRASGGTDIEAGYTLAAEALAIDPSPRKHIILLTDGGANEGQLVQTAQALRAADITTSVISIGTGPDFLAAMAQAGGGNYHEVLAVEEIPTIFASETVLASRAYIIEEEPFVPALSANSPIIDGITSAPPLLGYVATTLRQTAQVILRTPNDFADPILASWQYGLGRAVAFTSDAGARWATNWATWGEFARFWGQTVRWTITETADSNVEARIVPDGERTLIVVDARDAAGGFLNGLTLEASIVAPDLTAQRITLQQVAPGRYEAAFTTDDEGAYFVRLAGGSDEIAVNQTSGWVNSYSPEYDTRPASEGAALLADLAALTGGRSLVDAPAEAFAHTLQSAPSYTPIAHWLLLLAALLLPLDIALRRLLITRSDLARLRAALFVRREAAETSERMSTLMEAKQRAREATTGEGANTLDDARVVPTESRITVGARRASSVSAADAKNGVPTPSARPSPASPPPPAPGSTASKLLEKRKERDNR